MSWSWFDGSGNLLSVSPGYVPLSTVTTKGDLVVASAASTVGRLAVGASGQVLSVSSATPAWVNQPGKELANGYATTTTNTAALGVGSAATVLSITVTGDGVTPVWVEGSCGLFSSTSLDALAYILQGGTAIAVDRVSLWTANARGVGKPRIKVAAFSGAVTFILGVENVAGSGTLTGEASGNPASGPAYIRATWAG